MIKSGIYKITNKVNNKCYIGSAVNFKRRVVDHKKLLNNNKHYNRHLQGAWNKYGADSFKFELIEEVKDKNHLLAYEQVYFDYYKSYDDTKGYNICKIAGNTQGRKHTEEAKAKISANRIGKYKGVPKSESHKAAMKAGSTRIRAVESIDPDTGIVVEYKSLASTGFSHTCIISAIKRNHKHKGLYWRYL